MFVLSSCHASSEGQGGRSLPGTLGQTSPNNLGRALRNEVVTSPLVDRHCVYISHAGVISNARYHNGVMRMSTHFLSKVTVHVLRAQHK